MVLIFFRVLVAGIFVFIGIGGARTALVGLKGIRDGRTPLPGADNQLEGRVIEGSRARALAVCYAVGGAWIVFLAAAMVYFAVFQPGDC